MISKIKKIHEDPKKKERDRAVKGFALFDIALIKKIIKMGEASLF